MKLPTDPHARSPVRVRLSQAEALFALVLCGCALAACGSSNSSSAPYASRQNAQRINQQLKFNQCMRAHGVHIKDTATTPAAALSAGAPASILQQAIAACRQYQQGAFSTISPQDRSKYTHAFLLYAICLRAHGVNVPDPSESGGNGFGQKLLAASRAPNFQPANKACRGNLPGVLGGTGG